MMQANRGRDQRARDYWESMSGSVYVNMFSLLRFLLVDNVLNIIFFLVFYLMFLKCFYWNVRKFMIGCQSLLSVSMVTPVNRIVDERVLQWMRRLYYEEQECYIQRIQKDI